MTLTINGETYRLTLALPRAGRVGLGSDEGTTLRPSRLRSRFNSSRSPCTLSQPFSELDKGLPHSRHWRWWCRLSGGRPGGSRRRDHPLPVAAPALRSGVLISVPRRLRRSL